jgi:rubrerythrin
VAAGQEFVRPKSSAGICAEAHSGIGWLRLTTLERNAAADGGVIVSIPQTQESQMVTMVGNESSIQDLVMNLIYLEYDAIVAYESCIERLDDKSLTAQIVEFKRDHDEHLRVLNEMARQLGIDAPSGGDMKQMLTTGKIVIADMMGDAAILKAMKTNEDDTVTAYERASRHPDAIPESKAFFMKAHQDEQRHRAWMEMTATSV